MLMDYGVLFGNFINFFPFPPFLSLFLFVFINIDIAAYFYDFESFVLCIPSSHAVMHSFFIFDSTFSLLMVFT